ncbi:MAG TPA: carbohydrate ABC transporter permease [Chloroflexota bacterium]|jgi:multiple sugar transport system permease protein|nr:carbohydrate ABC transporter permease [Chloroflexota bacterium]
MATRALVARPAAARRGAPVGRIVARLLAHAVLVVGSGFMVMPFLWMISTSLKTEDQVFVLPPLWFPSRPVFSNYARLFETVPFGRYLFNSAFVSLAVMAGELLTSAISAFAFARLQFWGRDKIFAMYLATLMIPFHVRLIPIFLVMKFLGWLDTYYVLTVPHIFTVYGVFLFRQFFLTIPQELEDAARIDGCGHLRVLWNIILPLSGPVVATLAVFSFLNTWNDFLWPLVMTTSQHMRVLSVGLAQLQNEYFTLWTLLMAGAVLSLLPTLIVFLVAQRYFVQGITISGLKG